MAFAGVLRASRGEIEFAELVAIWRSAVDATHAFVSADDLDQIEAAMPEEYLPSVQLTVAEIDGRPVGFAGTSAIAWKCSSSKMRFAVGALDRHCWSMSCKRKA